MQNILLWTVGIIHVLVSLIIIALVLFRSGSGGMSDLFGGGMGPSGGGGSTVAERNLDRLTVITAGVFTFSTIGLAWLLG